MALWILRIVKIVKKAHGNYHSKSGEVEKGAPLRLPKLTKQKVTHFTTSFVNVLIMLKTYIHEVIKWRTKLFRNEFKEFIDKLFEAFLQFDFHKGSIRKI